MPKFIKHLTYDEYAKNSIRSYQKDILKLFAFLEKTGIRIGELQFITVKAINSGKVLIKNKGTVRTIVIHKDLQGYLSLYCREKNVKSGIVFTGSKGRPISRSYIARAMKEVAEQCGIDPAMVFPHNLRHYFARSFLDCGNPLSDLADILGHKSIDTTRRYLRTSAETKQKQLAKLKIIPNWQRNYGYSQEKIM
ncbi:tyrosine-type recombinase/integrase [Lysinibacillus sphaericus]|uniref:tyrosine-type recombinase/integrase n=1 Tax=Lysinibacillus sphaericus TaxID=1421 RepID=UPI001A9E867F|nr:tyrosine-type recombinase/integrase [Lysinibacillus sphaericus]QTB23774.1 tyrosine-type recombinase/integrase [Lysinibacillus sphaericus]